MTHPPDDPLTPQEFASLREIRNDNPMGRSIPTEHKEKLRRLGLIAFRTDVEAVLTEKGESYLSQRGA